MPNYISTQLRIFRSALWPRIRRFIYFQKKRVIKWLRTTRLQFGKMLMTEPQPIPVKIVPMMRTFLYLPVYVADDLGLFKKYIPQQYYTLDVEYDNRQGQTDETVCERVMDQLEPEVFFGVCDPMPIYERNLKGFSGENELQVIAALISKASFWAVDRNTKVSSLYHLPRNFNTFLAYHDGTTSNLLARDIINKSPGSTPTTIIPVDPKDLFNTLLESIDTVVAITPDILEAKKYEAERKLKICYPFSGVYSNLLVTALITRNNVIRDHRPLVIGVLRALETALTLIQLHDKQIPNIASKLFGYNRGIIDQALGDVLSQDLFHRDLIAERTAWINATEIYHQVKPSLTRDSSVQEKSFDMCVNRELVHSMRRKHILPLIIGEKLSFKEKIHLYNVPIAVLLLILASFIANNYGIPYLGAASMVFGWLMLVYGIHSAIKEHTDVHSLPWLLRGGYTVSWVVLFLVISVKIVIQMLKVNVSNSLLIFLLSDGFVSGIISVTPTVIFGIVTMADRKQPN